MAVAKFADVFEFDNSDQAAAVDVVALINVHLKDAYSEINSYLNARYQLPVFGSKVSVAAK
ncbi:MAG: hypothetical protein Rpha_1127 [Candidatus Ruthia sp. Apha_13_S6]|nr:hypothetical protein [Candidatus Ruthia sp. Apha_13_S6]